jgi:chromosomal replication initiation ATPase DnaA
MSQIPDIDKIPGLKDVLIKCRKEIEVLMGKEVTVFFKIKVRHLTTNDLARIICEVCEVKWEQVISESRKAPLVMARHFFIFFSLRYQKKTQDQIAVVINRDDHSTVIHARDKIQNMLDTNDELYMPYYTEIDKRINEILAV